MPPPGPDASVADKIKWSLEGIEQPSKYINTDDTDRIEKDVAKVDLEETQEHSLEDKIRRAFFDIGGPDVLKKKESKEEDNATEQDAVRLLAEDHSAELLLTAWNRVHPAEENAGGSTSTFSVPKHYIY